MNVLTYSQWADTAETIQLLSQMLGKVKLHRVPAQPEWGHILLYPTSTGFTTGIIPKGNEGFTIDLDILDSKVFAKTTEGKTAGFQLGDGKSISEYYGLFKDMLLEVTCHTDINPTPQEMILKTPFHEDHKKRRYDYEKAKDYFRMAVFVYNELTKFTAPFRNKKMNPGLFWGTFDITAILFEGEEKPFPSNAVIERSAFDEKMLEFGFWPGDATYEEPSFFVLPYPFLTDDLSKAPIKPDKAFYSPEKMEFFFSLKDVMATPDPSAALQTFFKSAFEIITTHEKWNNVNWYTKPLLMPIQP